MKHKILVNLGSAFLSLVTFASASQETLNTVNSSDTPNIIIILADDMGYGDVSAYNQNSKIKTTHIDALANEGVKFTDAHSASSVCTPSRYSLLTGQYAWRTRLKAGVLWGHSPALINKNTDTIGGMLQRKGYHTAAVGKWHLGMGGGEPNFYVPSLQELKVDQSASKVATKRIKPGPNEAGFDYFYGIPASLDMPPYMYIENGVPVTPLSDFYPAGEHRRDGGTGQMRKGPSATDFDPQTVLSNLTDKALGYIDSQAQSQQPFFLYFSLTAPHTPWLPEPKFRGKSDAGHYGDFVLQVDDVVGQVKNKLVQRNIDKNTIVIFTSDNGAQWISSDIKRWGHKANASLRGQKADIHEGGHKVPFIVSWPETLNKNATSEVMISLSDLMKTFAELTQSSLPEGSAIDSFSFLNNLYDVTQPFERPAIVHHSADGMFAIRDKQWKLIEGLGSGGFTKPRRIVAKDNQSHFQLYNLNDDPKELTNLAASKPLVVEKLLWKLSQIRKTE